MGVQAFGERARRERLATGEIVRKRTVETTGELTSQEVHIAQLARDGLSNPEIGARLFISAQGPVPPGQGLHQARAASSNRVLPGRRLRRRRRRCEWRAGPAAAPSAARNTGSPVRSPMARWIAWAVCGASGMVTTLPPLRVMVRVPWPRSKSRCSMSAPVASETRSPFSASSKIGACSVGGPSPAAGSAPRSCGRARRRETRSPPADDGRARRVTVARARPLLPVPGEAFDVAWRSDNTWAQSRSFMTGDDANHVQTFCLRY